jgi:hypothetical protein
MLAHATYDAVISKWRDSWANQDTQITHAEHPLSAASDAPTTGGAAARSVSAESANPPCRAREQRGAMHTADGLNGAHAERRQTPGHAAERASRARRRRGSADRSRG